MSSHSMENHIVLNSAISPPDGEMLSSLSQKLSGEYLSAIYSQSFLTQKPKDELLVGQF